MLGIFNGWGRVRRVETVEDWVFLRKDYKIFTTLVENGKTKKDADGLSTVAPL